MGYDIRELKNETTMGVILLYFDRGLYVNVTVIWQFALSKQILGMDETKNLEESRSRSVAKLSFWLTKQKKI